MRSIKQYILKQYKSLEKLRKKPEVFEKEFTRLLKFHLKSTITILRWEKEENKNIRDDKTYQEYIKRRQQEIKEKQSKEEETNHDLLEEEILDECKFVWRFDELSWSLETDLFFEKKRRNAQKLNNKK